MAPNAVVNIPIEKLISIDTQLATMAQSLARMEKCFSGNGQGGIMERLASIDQTNRMAREDLLADTATRKEIIDKLEQDVAKISEDMPSLRIMRSVFYWFLGVIGALVIALVWAILTHTIELTQIASK